MTREDAISVLERVAHTESKWPGTEDTLEALDMAIPALRQQNVTDKYVGKMTNADRIRSMSDEELAEFIPNWNFDACRWCDHYTACKDMVANNECEKCVLEWLQQPCGEEDEHEAD